MQGSVNMSIKKAASPLTQLTHDSGIANYQPNSWNDLTTFLFGIALHDTFAWRGQSDVAWPLLSSFDREYTGVDGKISDSSRKISVAAKKHLEGFKYAIRGKYPFDPTLSLKTRQNELDTENEWWALGQHYGLKTPLLDWTYSPFVALYFALRNHLTSDSLTCALWGITMLTKLHSAKFNISRLKSLDDDQKKGAVYRFFSQQTANNRLISQGGFFTRAPFGMAVDEWVRDTVTEYEELRGTISIIKIELVLTNAKIHEYIRYLQKMNINEMTLFPEVQGAAGLCNTALKVEKYYRWK